MCSDSEKNMSAFANQNHAPSLTCVRLEILFCGYEKAVFYAKILLSQFELRLPLLQVVSNNTYISVGEGRRKCIAYVKF